MAVLTPERLHADFIYNYFTTLRIVDKDVSVPIFVFQSFVYKIW